MKSIINSYSTSRHHCSLCLYIPSQFGYFFVFRTVVSFLIGYSCVFSWIVQEATALLLTLSVHTSCLSVFTAFSLSLLGIYPLYSCVFLRSLSQSLSFCQCFFFFSRANAILMSMFSLSFSPYLTHFYFPVLFLSVSLSTSVLLFILLSV